MPNSQNRGAELAHITSAANLPSGYDWGIAMSSRFRMRPKQHLMSPGIGVQMVCTGGKGMVENSGGEYCRACLAWLKELHETYGDDS